MTTEIEAADRLLEHEAIIERGLGSFIEVGTALIAIRDGKLYRATHSTFEAYCSDRWTLSRPYAYNLIDAAEAVRGLSAIADTPMPATESQARQIVGLAPEVAAEVMTKAAEDGKVTAATIKAAREHVAPTVKVTETTKTESYVDTSTGEIVDPPAELPSWKQNLHAQQERKDRDRKANVAVADFPELAYYLGKPDVDKAIETAASLRKFREPELTQRRATLARAIEADKAGVFDRIAAVPESVDRLAVAQDVFFALNAASHEARRLGGIDAIASAIADGADPALIDTWRQQFTDLAGLCADLAAACRPALRSVQ